MTDWCCFGLNGSMPLIMSSLWHIGCTISSTLPPPFYITGLQADVPPPRTIVFFIPNRLFAQ